MKFFFFLTYAGKPSGTICVQTQTRQKKRLKLVENDENQVVVIKIR